MCVFWEPAGYYFFIFNLEPYWSALTGVVGGAEQDEICQPQVKKQISSFRNCISVITGFQRATIRKADSRNE